MPANVSLKLRAMVTAGLANDVEAVNLRSGNRLWLEANAAENGGNQAERGDELARPLAEAGPCLAAKLKQIEPEHEMSEHGACAAANDLHTDIGKRGMAVEPAAQPCDQADRWVEVRARDRRKNRDDDIEHCAGRDRVAQKDDGLVTAGEVLGHNAGAYDRHHQDERAERLGGESPSHFGRERSPRSRAVFRK